MKLILTAIQHRTTNINDLPYVVLSFYYPAKEKEVEYNVWSFVHNEAHGLQHVWDNVQNAELGKPYYVHFQKQLIDGQQQFVVTSFVRLPNY